MLRMIQILPAPGNPYPINTLAGYTLNSRYRRSALTTAQVIGSIPLFVPIATTVKNVATKTVTLDARPSSPSVKFTPYTVPITTKNIYGIASHPMFRYLPPLKGISIVSGTPANFTI